MKKKIISTETEPSDLFLDTFLVKALKTIFGNNFEKEQSTKNTVVIYLETVISNMLMHSLMVMNYFHVCQGSNSTPIKWSMLKTLRSP